MKRVIYLEFILLTFFGFGLTTELMAGKFAEKNLCLALMKASEKKLCSGIKDSLSPARCPDDNRLCNYFKMVFRQEKCFSQPGTDLTNNNICLGFKSYIEDRSCKDVLKTNVQRYSSCLAIQAASRFENCFTLEPLAAKSICLGLRSSLSPSQIKVNFSFLFAGPEQVIGPPCGKESDPADHTIKIKDIRRSIEILFGKKQDQLKRGELQDKLESILKVYDDSKRKVLNLLKAGGTSVKKLVSRENWEKMVGAKSSQMQLTEEEISELRLRQEIIVHHAHENSSFLSLFDLDQIRLDENKVHEFCAMIPKGGMLHVHPKGTLNHETVEKLLGIVNPVLEPKKIMSQLQGPHFSLSEKELIFLNSLSPAPAGMTFNSLDQVKRKQFIDMFTFGVDQDVNSFERFESSFKLGSLYIYNYGNIGGGSSWINSNVTREYYLDFLRRAKNQHVSYVEFTEEIEPDVESLMELEKLGRFLEEETGVKVRWNLAFFRQDDRDSNKKKAKQLIEVLAKTSHTYIGGIDLYGHEDDYSALKAGQDIYLPVMLAEEQGKISDIRTTMHAGEFGHKLSNVRDALIFGVNRLGHALYLDNDPLILEYAMRRKVPIETSLESNLRLGAVKSIGEHPFLKFLRLGMKVNLSTDDEGIFESDINRECVLAITKTDMTYHELKEVIFNSLAQAFLNNLDKNRLLDQLKIEFERFENFVVKSGFIPKPK